MANNKGKTPFFVRSPQHDMVELAGVAQLTGAAAQTFVYGGVGMTLTRTATGSFDLTLGPAGYILWADAKVLPNMASDVPLRAVVSSSLVAGSGSYCTVNVYSTSGSAVDATTTKVDSAGSGPGAKPLSLLAVKCTVLTSKVRP